MAAASPPEQLATSASAHPAFLDMGDDPGPMASPGRGRQGPLARMPGSESPAMGSINNESFGNLPAGAAGSFQRRGSVHNPMPYSNPRPPSARVVASRPGSAMVGRPMSSRFGRPMSAMRPVSALHRPGTARMRSNSVGRSEGHDSSAMNDNDPNAVDGTGDVDAATEFELDEDAMNGEIEGQEDVPVCFRVTNHPSLNYSAIGIFSGTNRFRLLNLHIVTAKPFEAVIIVLILANCVVLAAQDPTQAEEPDWSTKLNYFFTAAFTLEMLMKMIGFGIFYHAGAYLRSGWNRLDFCIVILSYLMFVPGFGNYTALRAFRVLRPLRSMNAIPPLRQIVTVLLRSLSGLADVLLLIAFLFSIFGVFAVQLFMGVLKRRCRDDVSGELTEQMCSPGNTYGDILGVACPTNQTCVDNAPNPNNGYTNYDNVLWAWLVIVQVLTMEDWASLMYMLMSTWSFFASIYFVILVIVGAYLVLNLALAVISAEFEFAQEEMEERERFEREQRELEEKIASGEEAMRVARVNTMAVSNKGGLHASEPRVMISQPTFRAQGRSPMLDISGSFATSIDTDGSPTTIQHHGSSGFNRSRLSTSGADGGGGGSGGESSSSPPVGATEANRLAAPAGGGDDGSSEPTIDEDDASVSGESAEARILSVLSGTAVGADESPPQHHQQRPPQHQQSSGSAVASPASLTPRMGPQPRSVSDSGSNQSRATRNDDTAIVAVVDSRSNRTGVSAQTVNSIGDSISSEGDGAEPEPSGFEAMRLVFYRFVEGDPDLSETDRGLTLFGKIIIACILLNTAVLAADHHGASDTQNDVSRYMNYAFAGIFGVEFVLKLIAHTPWGYVQDAINVFDGFIVIVSFIEIGLGGNAQFSVLRTFRLLRVFKLLKSFPSLLAIVEVIAFAVRDTAYLNILIFLYLFIASLFGMQFFGAAYPQDDDEGEAIRSRFDNFFHAFFTVFQIMTRDDWPGLMHTAMQYTSDFAFLYFIACVVAGDLVILNLFLSVIISSFDKVGKQQDERRLIELEERELREQKQRRRNRDRAVVTTLSDGLDGRITTIQDLQMGAHTDLQRRDLKQIEAAGRTVENVLFLQGDMLNDEVKQTVEKRREQQLIVQEKKEAEKKAQKKRRDDAAMMVSSFDPVTGGASPKAGEQPSEIPASPHDGEKHHAAKGAGSPAASPGRNPLGSADSDSGGAGRGSEEADDAGAAPVLDFAEAVRVAQSLQFNHVGKDIVGICGRCGDPIVKPFPTASKDIKPMTPEALHDRYCDRIQVRKAKQAVITKLTRELDKKAALARMGKGRPQPTATYIEDMFGRAWETGLLLGEDFDEHLAVPSWDGLKAALKEEEDVLNLRVGEDQFGWALATYTRANVPGETTTNGGVSLFIFGRKNPLRVACTALASSPIFDTLIMVCIVISSLLLAIDDPRRPNSSTNAALEVTGDVFTVIFVVEMVIKVIALGFVLHPTAYLRDAWNVLDFCIVIISVVGWALRGITDVGFLKVLRTFRALRPLRVINRNRGLKMVVLTLIESVKGIFNVAMITLLIWLVFAILGTQLFGGRLYFCSDDSVNDRYACTGYYFPDDDANATATAAWASLDPSGTFNANTSAGYPHVFPNGSIVPGALGRDWITYDFNFDNSYNSFLTLFVIATLDDWSTKMYYTIDSTGVDTGPERGANEVFALYFIAFIIIGSFFLLSFFVGVVIRQYNMTKDQLDGLQFLTPEQKHWVETQRMVLNFRPMRRNRAPDYVPIGEAVITNIDIKGELEEENNIVYNTSTGEYEVVEDLDMGDGDASAQNRPGSTRGAGLDASMQSRGVTDGSGDSSSGYAGNSNQGSFMRLRVATFHMVETTGFELVTGFFVFLNIVVIGMEYHGQSHAWDELQRWSNVGFVAIFFFEFVAKIFGLGPRQYFIDGWNRFDFFLVLVGFVSLLDVLDLPINPNTLRVLRIFRIMRLLTLVKKAKGVRMLLETLWYSLPSLGNISLFLLLVFFIFAVLGVQLFANVRPSADGEYDDEWSNFKHFGNSFLMLVRITTMDNWGVILAATSNTEYCGKVETEHGVVDNCGVVYAPVFYLVFLVIAVFVLLNVFVAVILDNFNTTLKLDHSEVNVMDLKRFSDAWARFDEEANMTVETRHFPSLMLNVKPPLGLARRENRMQILKLAEHLNIPEHGGVIHFAETLIPLARAVQKVTFTDAELRDHEDSWKQQFPGLADLPVLRYRQKRITVDQYLAATYMQAARRRKLALERLDHLRAKKRQDVCRWYDIRNTPPAERTALRRLEDLQKQRLRMRREHNKEVAAKAEAAAAEADADAAADGEGGPLSSSTTTNLHKQQLGGSQRFNAPSGMFPSDMTAFMAAQGGKQKKNSLSSGAAASDIAAVAGASGSAAGDVSSLITSPPEALGGQRSMLRRKPSTTSAPAAPAEATPPPS